MVELIVSKHILKPQGRNPFHVLANQYSTTESAANTQGVTLVFLHAVGSHKESWEVTIQKLFELDGAGRRIIRDMFSIELPNHGESAALNEEIITKQFAESWPTRVIAQATHDFLSAGPNAGAKIDFGKRRLVGVGHSIGAAALFLMRDIPTRIKFEAIVAVEPGISIKELPGTLKSSQMLTAWTWLRRDVWPSRGAAKKDLAASPVYAPWDPRALDLYIKHGLRTHEAAKYKPPFSFRGITTCASKAQEAACYRSEHLVVDAMNAYTLLTQEIPVHVAFGSVIDVGGKELQDILSDKSAGRHPASVSYIKGAGHLAVQHRPEAVAECIATVLAGSSTNVSGRL